MAAVLLGGETAADATNDAPDLAALKLHDAALDGALAELDIKVDVVAERRPRRHEAARRGGPAAAAAAAAVASGGADGLAGRGVRCRRCWPSTVAGAMATV